MGTVRDNNAEGKENLNQKSRENGVGKDTKITEETCKLIKWETTEVCGQTG